MENKPSRSLPSRCVDPAKIAYTTVEMQCPNAIYLDSKLLKKDTFWHIDRSLDLKPHDQLKNGGVRRVNSTARAAVLPPRQQSGLGPEALINIIRGKINEKTQNSDRWTNVYKLWDRPNQGLTKEHLAKKLRSWGVVPEQSAIDKLFKAWGAVGRRKVIGNACSSSHSACLTGFFSIDFRYFLEQVMGQDYTDLDQKLTWNFAPAKKGALAKATQRQTQRANCAIHMHMEHTRKGRQAQVGN